MIALLIRLQIRLTMRSFSGNTAKIVGMVFLSLYAFGILAAMLLGMIALRQAGPDWAGPVTILLFSFVTLLWPVLMVLLGSNDALAPARFALFPVRSRQLQPGLLVATLFTFGGVVSMVLLLGYLIAWSASPMLFMVACAAAVLGVAYAILVTRTLTAGMAATLASRKFRDLVVILVGLFAMLFALSGQFIRFFTGASLVGERLVSWANIAAWTPLGWPWALPWDVARGDWAIFAIRLVLTIGCSVALWRLWGRFLDRALTSPLEAGGGATKVKGNGRIDRLMPAGPAGAIGARTLRYWARDPRRKMQAISILVMPVVFTAMMFAQGDGLDGPGMLFIPPISMALVGLTLTWSELSYDGSAVWQQIASGVSGRTDRIGRLIGLGWLMVPFALVLWLGYHAWAGHWDFAVVSLAGMIAALGVTTGVGSLGGAVFCYAMPPTGTGMNSRGNLSASLGVLVSMLVCGLVLLPVGIAAIAAYESSLMAWISPLLSIAIGMLTLWLGIRLGGRYLDDNWPEVLERVTWDKP